MRVVSLLIKNGDQKVDERRTFARSGLTALRWRASHFKENDGFVKSQGGVPPQDLAGENGLSFFRGSFQILRDFHGFNRRISKDHGRTLTVPITKTKKTTSLGHSAGNLFWDG